MPAEVLPRLALLDGDRAVYGAGIVVVASQFEQIPLIFLGERRTISRVAPWADTESATPIQKPRSGA